MSEPFAWAIFCGIEALLLSTLVWCYARDHLGIMLGVVVTYCLVALIGVLTIGAIYA